MALEFVKCFHWLSLIDNDTNREGVMIIAPLLQIKKPILRTVEKLALCHLTSKWGGQNSNPVLLEFKSHSFTTFG